MNTPPPPDTLHFFVDEAGDPTLFDAKGRILVGQEGCSKTFIVGKLDVENPAALHSALEQLRAELLADPYFKRVPSMQAERGKTSRVFHAKDDVPEVRREVFKLLARFDLRFYGVVRHKAALLDYVRQRNEREAAYRYRGDEIYDTLVEELFRRYHPLADRLEICFATRGNKARTHAFRTAITKAEARFESQYGIRRSAEVTIIASTPPERAGLQAVDYFLWALQRHYERDESRYLELMWPQVVEIEDLDRIERGRKGVVYNKKRPLIVDQEAQE